MRCTRIAYQLDSIMLTKINEVLQLYMLLTYNRNKPRQILTLIQTFPIHRAKLILNSKQAIVANKNKVTMVFTIMLLSVLFLFQDVKANDVVKRKTADTGIAADHPNQEVMRQVSLQLGIVASYCVEKVCHYNHQHLHVVFPLANLRQSILSYLVPIVISQQRNLSSRGWRNKPVESPHRVPLTLRISSLHLVGEKPTLHLPNGRHLRTFWPYRLSLKSGEFYKQQKRNRITDH